MSPVTGEPITARGRRAAVGTVGMVTMASLAGAWIVARLGKVEVTGHSMAPTLADGDRLLVLRRGGPWRGPRPGDIVTLADPRSPRRTIVKRFARATAAGADVRGDAPAASTDSRTFGPVPVHALGGRVVYRYAPPDRAGRLSS